MRIVQHGCLGTRNFGDERGAWMVRRILRHAFPQAEIAVIGSNMGLLARYHSDADILCSYNDKGSCLDTVKRADVLIHGPGTMIGPQPMPLALDLAALDTPLILWGVGAWDHLFPPDPGMELLARAHGIGVRDMYAYNVVLDALSAIGDPTEPVFSGDPLFLDVHPGSPKTSLPCITISWHLAKCKSTLQAQVMRTLGEFVTEWASETGKQWIGLPAAWDPDKPHTSDWDNDLQLLWRLQRETGGGKGPIASVLVPTDFDDLARMLSCVELLVTSRLHTGVVAAANGADVCWFGQRKLLPFAALLGADRCFAGDYTAMTVASLRDGCQPNPDAPHRLAELQREIKDQESVLVRWIEEATGERACR